MRKRRWRAEVTCPPGQGAPPQHSSPASSLTRPSQPCRQPTASLLPRSLLCRLGSPSSNPTSDCRENTRPLPARSRRPLPFFRPFVRIYPLLRSRCPAATVMRRVLSPRRNVKNSSAALSFHASARERPLSSSSKVLKWGAV